jgi:methanethiol S-methyltransferase
MSGIYLTAIMLQKRYIWGTARCKGSDEEIIIIMSYILIVFSLMLGVGSLVICSAFCFFGSFGLVPLGLSESRALLMDAGLSLAFFLQHSGMVRKPFRQYLSQFVREAYLGAIYTIVSGIVLSAVIILWQDTSATVVVAVGFSRLMLRMIFIAAVAGLLWAMRSLEFYDLFGILMIFDHLRGRKRQELPLKVRGPYRWVRHPQYLCVLIMIWSFPDLTLDRLLFNVLWTAWIYIGAILEERSLIVDFGEPYQLYQMKVPMLIPSRVSPSWTD